VQLSTFSGGLAGAAADVLSTQSGSPAVVSIVPITGQRPNSGALHNQAFQTVLGSCEKFAFFQICIFNG
jgi:hypothetical protein